MLMRIGRRAHGARARNFLVTGQIEARCLGEFLLAYFPVPQNCCRKGNHLFSICISQKICLDRHVIRFELLPPNTDIAAKLSINNSSDNSHRH